MSRSNLYSELTEILPFLPVSFIKRNHTLDAALDGYRSHKTLSASALDLILMSYRYAHWFHLVSQKFSQKKIKPPALKDLWLAGFTALLTRDKTPSFAIVSECVEVSKTLFGPHTASITNAFLRHVDRIKPELLAQQLETPEIALPEWLRSRWKHSHFLKIAAQAFVQRPESGVWGFSKDLNLTRKEWSKNTFDGDETFQAMNAGSHEYCVWTTSKLSATDKTFVDTCAAPGGKAIYMIKWLESQKRDPHFILCEAKSNRIQTLKENILRWKIPASKASFELLQWGKETPPASITNSNWDFVLADLPCSGSGTFLTRPDVLFRDWAQDMGELKAVQAQILTDVLKIPTRKVFVSICSVDEEEVAHISQILGKDPDFSSWSTKSSFAECSEGITAWYCER